MDTQCTYENASQQISVASNSYLNVTLVAPDCRHQQNDRGETQKPLHDWLKHITPSSRVQVVPIDSGGRGLHFVHCAIRFTALRRYPVPIGERSSRQGSCSLANRAQRLRSVFFLRLPKSLPLVAALRPVVALANRP